MKTKLLLTLFLSFFLAQMHAQKTSGKQLVRSTMGVSGSSETIKIHNKTYVVQQSIGQGVQGMWTVAKECAGKDERRWRLGCLCCSL